MKTLYKRLICFWNGHDYTALKQTSKGLLIGHYKNCIHCGVDYPKGIDFSNTIAKREK